MPNTKRSQFLLKLLVLVALILATTHATNAAGVDYSKLEVSQVWGVDKKTGELTDESNGLYNIITLRIEWLPEWASDQSHDPSKLILYLDGYPLKDLPVKIDQVPDNKFSYVLFPRDATEQGWKQLLGGPRSFKRPVAVTAGLEGQTPIKSKPLDLSRQIKLTILSRGWFWVFVVALILLICFFVWLARASDVLRDAGPQPKSGRKTYSLGRTQMAFWFLIVVASYVFIWLVTSAYGTLSASVLGLIGISAGTALAAAVIDTNKRNSVKSDLETLTVEKATLEAEQKTLQANGSDLDAAKKTRLTQVNDKIAEIKPLLTPQQTSGFFNDILSDANGISFHRFQIAVWTLVLGVIFIAQVYNVLSMPDFPETLLALMGISGGTYIGFKFPEKEG